MNDNVINALQELKHVVAVAAELKAERIFREIGIYPFAADAHVVQGELYRRRLLIDDNFGPILENALKGEYPKAEDFDKKLDWHEYPLEGVILHRLVNVRSCLDLDFIQRHIPPNLYDGIKMKWTKDPMFIPYVETALDERLKEKIRVIGGKKNE